MKTETETESNLKGATIIDGLVAIARAVKEQTGTETESDLEGMTIVDGLFAIARAIKERKQNLSNNAARADAQRLVSFLDLHPGCEMEDILSGLSMSKRYALQLIERVSTSVRTDGKGVKGNPYKYYAADVTAA